MQTLPILDSEGKLFPLWQLIVWATMIYPGTNDAARRTGFRARVVAGSSADRGDLANLAPKILLAALNADPLPNAPNGDSSFSRAGELAGLQMAMLYSLTAQGVDGASRRMAGHVVECLLADKGLPGGRTTLDAAWRSHGSAAHLWAAWALRGSRLVGHGVIDGGRPHTVLDDFDAFMWEAAFIQQVAEDHEPRAKAQIVHDFWGMPPDMPPFRWDATWPKLEVRGIKVTPLIAGFIASMRDGAPRRPVGRPSKKG